MDVVYLIDMIRCFTQPFSMDGRVVYNRKDIANHYLKTWFIFDIYAFFPLAYFRYVSDYNAGGKDNVKNFLTLNFERLPRFYKLMLIPQLTRARETNNYFKLILKRYNLKLEIQNLIQTFVVLSYVLHVIGCFWYAAKDGDIYHYMNWVRNNGLEDEGMFLKYIASCYWATVTCTTVGYGDILPTNNYELLWAMCIIVFGVAIFSYILSDLSSKFSEITRSNASNQERIQQIDQLDQKFHIGPKLVEQLH